MASSLYHPTSASEAPMFKSASTPASSASMALQDTKPPTIQFTTVEALFEHINHVPGDILIVTDVSYQDFAIIKKEREIRRRKIRFRRYHADSRLLVITIPTRTHELLHLQLYQQYLYKLVPMNLQGHWTPIGATTLQAREGHPGGNSGEGDSSGGPKPDRRGHEDWPTLVIEAGDSESLPELRNDMRWWFSTSNHEVKIVILAKFNHGERSIMLEKWEEEERAPRQGAATTRWSAAMEPVLQQTITITYDNTGDPGNAASYTVNGGALVLEFRLLFLRDPGPGEGDIVFSIPELQSYAADVWPR
ncbi:hypothetical protein OIDMADRAFT_144956 [Oidiodendron maius Zn]|uniref:Uncharacterized protein n=1 Tax=Oidiodendron maius (strain Zn) TaxID=913774 RepID=A0A0C3CTT2_OIDMZ|nr:hypothetical protein OIDMADRAFT_144956 [Oidiodendron maius Zn]